MRDPTGFWGQGIWNEHFWSSNYWLANPKAVSLPLVVLAVSGYDPLIVVPENKFIELPQGILQLFPQIPGTDFTENHFIGIPLAELTSFGWFPEISVSEHRFVDLPTSYLYMSGYTPGWISTDNVFVSLDKTALPLNVFFPQITVPEGESQLIALSLGVIILEKFPPTLFRTTRIRLINPWDADSRRFWEDADSISDVGLPADVRVFEEQAELRYFVI